MIGLLFWPGLFAVLILAIITSHWFPFILVLWLICVPVNAVLTIPACVAFEERDLDGASTATIILWVLGPVCTVLYLFFIVYVLILGKKK